VNEYRTIPCWWSCGDRVPPYVYTVSGVMKLWTKNSILLCTYWFHLRNWILSQNLNPCFYLNLNYFFTQVVIVCLYLCSSNKSSSTMCLYVKLAMQYQIVFQQLVYFKSFLTCLVCFISTILGTNSQNSADVPLINKLTNMLNIAQSKRYVTDAQHRWLMDNVNALWHGGDSYRGELTGVRRVGDDS